MSAEVTNRLAVLSNISTAELRALWKQLFRGSTPSQLRRGLLIRVLAYKIQEQAYGGLKPETRKRLRELARKFAANPNAEISGLQQIKPGTRLIREWRGKSHQVTVLENGFEYVGQCYSSLSEIARLITSTRWSGPLFFGLNGKHTKAHIDAKRN